MIPAEKHSLQKLLKSGYFITECSCLSSVMVRGGSVYIVTNKNNTTLYIGVTSDLLSRIIQHLEKHYPQSFTAKYNLNKLIYFEHHSTIIEAIAREKQLKRWSRIKKERLINSMNPEWRDLFEDIKDW